MCGIAGILTPGRVPSAVILDRLVEAMVHRGPDGVHTWRSDDIALGMRRLAIVDVDGGAQPLRNETGTIHAIFNGEIYNHEILRADLRARGHRFDSRTDGAVLPHLYEEYGPELFARLDGIFAVALWDQTSRTLLLARDQMGVKPLYFHRHGAELRFASEIKALMEDPMVPRELDFAALDQHLTYRFTPAPRTLLKGIEKLEPGHALVWRNGTVRINRYWGMGVGVCEPMSFEDAAETFRDGLRAAVHRQMMSDRPIGVMLSGGIDSAAIVALMSERSSQVKTFTVGWEGGGDGDETALARATADLFATDHTDLVMPARDFAAELPRVIEMLEEPVTTSSAFGFRMVSRLAREQVPVLLSGQGADELLGGYWRYIGEWVASRALSLPRPLPWVLPQIARASRRARSPRIERGLRALRQPDPLDRFMDIYAVFTPAAKKALYRHELAREHFASGGTPAAPVQRIMSEVQGSDTLTQMMYIDLRLWLPDDLLLVGDKMSMAESVEMRVPFLDQALVSFVESLPSSFKVRRGRRKALEKAALEPLLPRSIVYRKEQGFYTPLERWLRTGMGSFAREILLAPDGHTMQLFQESEVEGLLRRHLGGKFDHTRQIFTLLSFELWARRFLGGRG